MDEAARLRAERYAAGDVSAQLARTAAAASCDGAAAAAGAAVADGPLSALDQCVVLALCLDVRNSNPADGLTAEEMRTCVGRRARGAACMCVCVCVRGCDGREGQRVRSK